MEVKDFFPSNQLKNNEIYIMGHAKHRNAYIQNEHIMLEFDYSEYFKPYPECTPFPCMIIKDNSILIRVLKKLETILPLKADEDLIELINEFPFLLDESNMLMRKSDSITVKSEEECSVYRVKIDDFLDRLYDLYTLFVSYKVLVWKTQCVPQHIFDYLRECYYDKNSQNYVELCLDYIGDETGDDTLYIKSEFQIHFQKGLQKVNSCDTALVALRYLIIQYIYIGEDGLEGYTLSKCSRCGAEFVRDTAKRKLCEECGSPRARTRAWRARKGGE